MIDQTSQNFCNRAKTALESSPIFELRSLSIRNRGGSLLISGRVSCFYHKQLAQEAVRAVALDLELINDIEVQLNKPR